jgi:GxxExxY protein
MPYDEEIPPYGDVVQPPAETNELAHRVLGICIEVHRELGPGLPEAAYEKALAMEFDRHGVKYSRQHRIEVKCKGVVVAIVAVDFVIEEKFVLEVKSVEVLTRIDRRQVMRYLHILKMPLGLLVNFNVILLKEGIRRIFRTEPPTQ